MLRKILIQIHILEMPFSRVGAGAAHCCWDGCKWGCVVSGVCGTKAQVRSRALARRSTRLVALVPAPAGYWGLIHVGIHIP